MKISAKTDYACRALLVLALNWPKQDPMVISDIAEHQDIPINFLTQILIQLKNLGYVESVRGNKGGYILIKNPKSVNVGMIFSQFNDSALKTGIQSPKVKADIFKAIWSEADSVYLNFLNQITFEDLVLRFNQIDKVSMYTI